MKLALFVPLIFLIQFRLTSQNLQHREATRQLWDQFGDRSVGIKIGTVRFVGDVGDVTELMGSSTPFHAAFDGVYQKTMLVMTAGSQYVLFGIDLNAGYRYLHAKHPLYEFHTAAIPVSAALSGEIYLHRICRPFISIGAGLLPYDVHVAHMDASLNRSRSVVGSQSGIGVWFPLRGGFKIGVSDNIDISLAVERSITLTDRMDGIVTSTLDWLNDNFETLMIGVSFHLGMTDDSIVMDVSDESGTEDRLSIKRDAHSNTATAGENEEQEVVDPK